MHHLPESLVGLQHDTAVMPLHTYCPAAQQNDRPKPSVLWAHWLPQQSAESPHWNWAGPHSPFMQHWPPVQVPRPLVMGGPQLWPQPPQLFTSLAVSTHMPWHSVWPEGQPQVPLRQMRSPEHGLVTGQSAAVEQAFVAIHAPLLAL
jgi:hypothetical protein